MEVERNPELDRALRNMADEGVRLQQVESLEAGRQEAACRREWVQVEALTVWTAHVLLPSRLPEASIPALGQLDAVLETNRPWRPSSTVTLRSALVLPTPPSNEWKVVMYLDVRSPFLVYG